MSDLDPAHVEAVAGCLVSDHDCYHCLTHEDWSIPVEGGPCQTGREQAKKMLTSTDPDVYAAFLAALVRADLGEVQWRVAGRAGRVQRRYVTRWEDVEDDE